MRSLLICILIVIATIEANPRQVQVEASGREQSPDAARVRAEEDMRDALKVMRDADKLTDEQVEELFNIVFPKGIGADVGYEAFLKENPDMAKAVKSGKISEEDAIAKMNYLSGDKITTAEEQLQALYQKLLQDDPDLKQTPKEELMPRLKAMLEGGEGKSLSPEKSTNQREMTYGLYFNELIESGQVERSDKDMQKVYDLGVAEIDRQGGGKEQGQAEDQDREALLEGEHMAAERSAGREVVEPQKEADIAARGDIDADGKESRESSRSLADAVAAGQPTNVRSTTRVFNYVGIGIAVLLAIAFLINFIKKIARRE